MAIQKPEWFKMDPAKPQERLKFANLLPYIESTRAAVKYMVETKRPQKPCIMHQDDEYGKNILDGFSQQLSAMKVPVGTITSFKRGATDFSAQVARMKADNCDLVVLGTVIRETIGAMGEARKLGWDVTFLGATLLDTGQYLCSERTMYRHASPPSGPRDRGGVLGGRRWRRRPHARCDH